MAKQHSIEDKRRATQRLSELRLELTRIGSEAKQIIGDFESLAEYEQSGLDEIDQCEGENLIRDAVWSLEQDIAAEEGKQRAGNSPVAESTAQKREKAERIERLHLEMKRLGLDHVDSQCEIPAAASQLREEIAAEGSAGESQVRSPGHPVGYDGYGDTSGDIASAIERTASACSELQNGWSIKHPELNSEAQAITDDLYQIGERLTTLWWHAEISPSATAKTAPSTDEQTLQTSAKGFDSGFIGVLRQEAAIAHRLRQIEHEIIVLSAEGAELIERAADMRGDEAEADAQVVRGLRDDAVRLGSAANMLLDRAASRTGMARAGVELADGGITQDEDDSANAEPAEAVDARSAMAQRMRELNDAVYEIVGEARAITEQARMGTDGLDGLLDASLCIQEVADCLGRSVAQERGYAAAGVPLDDDEDEQETDNTGDSRGETQEHVEVEEPATV